MLKRKIFKKKKSYRKLFLLFLFFFFITFILFYISNANKDIVIIPENKNLFYIIPEDRGGEKVQNLDKKSLNLTSYIKSDKINNIQDRLFFSIQIYSNSNLLKVSKYLEKLISISNTIYNIDDLYILELNSEIAVEYLLLYKNFEKRNVAYNYCLDFLSQIENCLIVDTSKF